MRKFLSVHDSHCCKTHGCKYGDLSCPVEYGGELGIDCELCDEDNQEKDKKTCKYCDFFDYLLLDEGSCIHLKNNDKSLELKDTMCLEWVTVDFGCIHWEKRNVDL